MSSLSWKIFFFPIPHCAHTLAKSAFHVAVKLCNPLTFLESRSVFCPNLGSREYPSRACFRLLTLDTVSFQFATFPTSMMTVFVMTLGELSYEDRFMPWDSLEYPTLANILFFMFVLGMPIILMNMLVSMPFRRHERNKNSILAANLSIRAVKLN